jgi:hypothetical protein
MRTTAREFNRGSSYTERKLTFADGATVRAYLDGPSYYLDPNEIINGRYGHYSGWIDLRKPADLEFNWLSRVATIRFTNSTIQFREIAPKQKVVNAQTELGRIEFEWERLVSSVVAKAPKNSPKSEWLVKLADGTGLAAESLGDYDHNDHLLLDGHRASSISWNNADFIDPPQGGSGSAKVRFRDGTEHDVQVGEIRAYCVFGAVDFPLNRAALLSIGRTSGGSAPPQSAPKQSLTLKDGSELRGIPHFYGVVETTVYDVMDCSGCAGTILHLVNIDVPLGVWLTTFDSLDLTVADGSVMLRALGINMPVKSNTKLNSRWSFQTSYGNVDVEFSDIASVNSHSPVEIGAFRNSVWNLPRKVSLTLKDGSKSELTCGVIQFARYPDRIYSGTTYLQELGAYHWHVEDKIMVKTESGLVDVDLDKATTIKLGGDWPSWEIEVSGGKSGSALRGSVVPAEVGSPSIGGVFSWDEDREGFWFRSLTGSAFLFVPASKIADITVRRGQ